MEDSVTESESVVPPLNLNLKGGSKYGKKEEKHKADEAEGQVSERTAKDDEKVSGGFISHLISNLPASLSPLSPKSRQIDEGKASIDEVKDKGKGEEEGSKAEVDVGLGGGGGLVNNLISNFLHQSEGEGEEKDKKNEEEKAEVAEEKEVKTKEEEGGGIIGNLVSHLPISFSDAAVPATDEAAILIHSIIHD